MATFTNETIERADFSQLIRALADQKKAEHTLEVQSKQLGVTQNELKKALIATADANEVNLKAAERAAKAWAREEKELNDAVTAELNAAKRQIDAETRRAASIEKTNAAMKKRADERAYLHGLRAASEEMERASMATRGTTAAMGAAVVSSGALRASYVNLGNQAADVAAQLQAGINPMTILVQQGSQVAAVFGSTAGLATKFASALSVLGASAAGAAVLGAPLLAWSKALDEQNEKTTESVAALGDAVDLMAKGASKIGDLQKELERSALKLAGKEGIVEGMEAAEEAGAAYDDMLQGLNLSLNEHNKMLKDVEDGADGFLEAAFGPSGIERAKQADVLKETIKGLKIEIENMGAEQQTATDTAELLALGERAVGEESKGAAKKSLDFTNALRAQLDAMNAVITAQSTYLDQLEAIGDTYTAPAGEELRTVHQIYDEKMRLMLAEVTEREKTAIRAANAELEALSEAQEKALDMVRDMDAKTDKDRERQSAALRTMLEEQAEERLAVEEQIQEQITEAATQAAQERADIEAGIRAEEAAARKADISKMADEWSDALIKQSNAEASAAAKTQQIASTRRDALLSVTDSLASSAADAFGAESAVAKVAAGIQLAIAEVEVLAKAASLGPIAGPIYGILGTAAVAAAGIQLAGIDTNISSESHNDTPGTQRRKAGPGGLRLDFAPGDDVEFRAARRPQDLDRQAGGGSPANVSTTVRFVVSGRTAQSITTSSANTTRGRPPGSPIPGRSRAR